MRRLLVGAMLIVGLAACYSPPPYVAPTAPPTSTPAPANATAVAVLQNGPTATQIALVAATSIAASTVHITNTSLDPENMGNSSVTVTNSGAAIVDLSGWTLLVSNYRVALPTTQYMSVGPGSSLILHLSTSQTPASGQNVYVGLGALSSTPRADADRTVLLTPSGEVASTYPPT